MYMRIYIYTHIDMQILNMKVVHINKYTYLYIEQGEDLGLGYVYIVFKIYLENLIYTYIFIKDLS